MDQAEKKCWDLLFAQIKRMDLARIARMEARISAIEAGTMPQALDDDAEVETNSAELQAVNA